MSIWLSARIPPRLSVLMQQEMEAWDKTKTEIVVEALEERYRKGPRLPAAVPEYDTSGPLKRRA